MQVWLLYFSGEFRLSELAYLLCWELGKLIVNVYLILSSNLLLDFIIVL